MRKQYHLSLPTYAKRSTAIAQIPNFWPLVLEQAPQEIDQYIQPQDSALFAEALTGLTVSRPEIEPSPTEQGKHQGNPRSLRFRFEFAENEWFEDQVLEKTFWYRRARDGWTGLVSEPVDIKWKAGKDLTQGLLGKAVKLFEARKAKGNMLDRGLGEFAVLRKAMDSANPATESFFTWFGFVSSRRWVGVEESEAAMGEHLERRERRKRGEVVEEPAPEVLAKAAVEAEEEAELEEDDGALVELNPEGDELAIALADDVWPGAIKYFLQAQEMDDDEMSDGGFEVEGEISDLEGDDGEGEPVDIRALVGKGPKGGKGRSASGSGQPPSKKMKK